jgi:hypothetical protein
VQVGQKLHAVQVTPYPLAQMVVDRQLLPTLGAGKPLSRAMTYMHLNMLPFDIEFHTLYRPRPHQTQQLSVQFHAFHRTLPLQDVPESLLPTHTIV